MLAAQKLRLVTRSLSQRGSEVGSQGLSVSVAQSPYAPTVRAGQILHPSASTVDHPASTVGHPTSTVGHPASTVHPPVSTHRPPSSRKWRPVAAPPRWCWLGPALWTEHSAWEPVHPSPGAAEGHPKDHRLVPG